MVAVVNINEVLDGHVALEVECVDGLYLNAYVPILQVGGQVKRFLEEHLGNPIPSPAIIDKIGNRFRREVKAFAVTKPHPAAGVEEAGSQPVGWPHARSRSSVSRRGCA